MTTSERLRVLADWFDEHPDAKVPYNFNKGNSFYISLEDKDAFKNIGSFKKEWIGSSLHAQVNVGELTLVYFIDRSAVCTARVVGKKQVPEEVIEGVPTRITPAHEEDIIEWDCAPILGDESANEAAGA